jgi:hypothetical protein
LALRWIRTLDVFIRRRKEERLRLMTPPVRTQKKKPLVGFIPSPRANLRAPGRASSVWWRVTRIETASLAELRAGLRTHDPKKHWRCLSGGAKKRGFA